MQTEVMQATAAAAWLEHTPPSSSGVEKISLEHAPFCLGRSETCDFPIDSNRVSREHAVIERQGSGWRVRDLKSTNGTFVNGERIDEAPLADGDTLVAADVEFRFRLEEIDAATIVATQLMGEGDTRREDGDSLGAWVRTLRRLREALLRGGLPNQFLPLARLDSGELVGYEAASEADEDLAHGVLEKRILATECLFTDRLRQMQRMRAVEEASELEGRLRLVLRLTPAEVGERRLLESLELLQEQAGERPLTAGIPFNAVCDTPHFREFLEQLRERGIGVLYDQFAGRSSQAALAPGLSPDFLKLAPSLTRGVEHSSDRRRQIEAIVRACGEAECEVIAAGLNQVGAAEACRDLGCALGQGDYFGRPVPAPELHDDSRKSLTTG